MSLQDKLDAFKAEFEEVNPDYTRRPDPGELLPVLRRLRTDVAA
jgi:hypothetical protein